MSGAGSVEYGDVLGGQLHLVIEGLVAAVVVAVFVVGSLTTLRERFRDTSAWHVHLGAAITGLVTGVVIGFVLFPLRLAIMQGQFPPGATSWSFLGFFAITVALRRGLLGRLPFLGPQVRAYRRATLRRNIERSEKELAKLSKKLPQGDAAATKPATGEAGP